MTYAYKTMDSPVGGLTLVASDKGLAAVLWAADDPLRVRLSPRVEQPQRPVLVEAERQIDEYFAGQRKVFELPLDFVGTAFQRKVWEALVRIPFGRPGPMARSHARSGAPGP
jgi:methylated-DNA-[protein]-cysteine S-methyltransferase